MSVLPEGDWPPSIGRQYTRLAMIEIERDSLPGAEFAETMERDYIHGKIDNIVGRKQEIGLSEVFLKAKPSDNDLKILMDGAPGVGKTTLSRKICKDWASGEFLQQYHLVVLVQLRDVHINKAKTIEDLFCADDPSLKEQVIRHIRETSGENILLILDGYDELGYEERIQHSLFLDIIKGEKLNKCSVLVTSRPYASDYLQQLECIDRHVEVLGFTEEQIRECVMQNIPNKAKATELVRLLQERMDITSLCYIPLNCAIMLYVYKQEYSLPTTLTKLFEVFILNALKRQPKHLTSCDQRILGRTKSLDNLPQSLKQPLDTLSKLAFDCMVKDKLVLEYMDLVSAFPDCADVETNLLSLMTAVKTFSQTGLEANYQFLHLTIQEFLAARWVVNHMPTGDRAIFMKDHLKDDRFRIMMLFLAGLSRLEFASTDSIFCSELDLQPTCDNRLKNCQLFLYQVHLIFESQRFNLNTSLAAAIKGQEIFLRMYKLTPFDCLVLGHFLHWSGCCWKSLDLSNCSLTGRSLEIFHQVSSGQKGNRTQIEQVDFSYNDPSFLTQVSLIPKILWFEHTKVIVIEGIAYPEGVPQEKMQVFSILSMKCLTKLRIRSKYDDVNESKLLILGSKPVTHDTGMHLIDHQSTHIIQTELIRTKSLRHLVLIGNYIRSSGAVRIFTWLQHNTSLEELNLSGNGHLTEGDSEAVGCAIERMLTVNRTLKVLDLHHCGLDDTVAKHIAAGLAINTSLESLDLSRNNNINITGIVRILQTLERREIQLNLSLFDHLFLCHRLYLFDPSPQPLDEETTAALCYLLKDAGNVLLTKTQFQRIAVSFLNLGVVVIDYKHLPSIKLHLKKDVTADACERFFRALNQSHMEHHLSVKDLMYQTVEPFTVGLAESTSLKVLDFSNVNEINSSGAVRIFTWLQHNTSLEELNLSGNGHLTEGDSEAVGCAIERMLTVNRTLKVLNLSHCGLDDTVAKHIAAGLAINTSLESLDLSGNNNINITGIVRILQTLERREIQLNLSLSDRLFLCQRLYLLYLSDSLSLSHRFSLSHRLSLLHRLSLSDQLSLFHQLSLSDQSPQPWDEETTAALCYLLKDAGNVLLTKTQFQRIAVSFLNLGLVVIDYKHLPSIKLHLSEDVTADACERFFRALNQSHMEHHLSVEGLLYQTAEPFTVGLAESTSLKVLDLSGFNDRMSVVNEINSSGAVSIFTSLQHNTSLEELSLSGNSHLTEGGSEAVGCAIERVLTASRTLRLLKLSHCGLDDTVGRHITAGLAINTSLESLDLSRNNINITGVVIILQALEQHEIQLNLSLSDKSPQPLDEETTSALCYLLKNALLTKAQLQTIAISFLNLGKLVIDYKPLPSIKLHLSEDVTADACERFFRALNQSHMEHHLSVKDLMYQTVEPFTVGLAESTSLKVLDFSNVNEINSSGAVRIFTWLQHNTSLEELNLSGNGHLTEGDSEAVGCAIERMLTVNRTLKVLNLSHCGLDDTVAKHIAVGLAINTSLESLDLSGNNNINITGIVRILQTLERREIQLNLSLFDRLFLCHRLYLLYLSDRGL